MKIHQHGFFTGDYMKDLAARARSGKLNPIEYTGGTTTFSNLERFGTHEFSAIINPPHATILAVGAGERQPVVVANSGDDITVATMMAVTLSADHRGVDGALAAQLLAAFRRLVEEPVHLVA